jgi:LPXTG-motif cell wall-anchored protein
MKNRQFSLLTAAGLICAGTFLVSPVKAGEFDMLTHVKFDQPVEIPGMVLPPGSYTMKILPRLSTPDVVVFSNATDQHVYEMVLALPVYRMEPADHTIITFAERAGNAPAAIKDWWYPGRNYGEEFLYQKADTTLTASAATPAAVAPAPPPAPPAPAEVAPVPESQTAPQSSESQAAPRAPIETAQAQPAPAPAPESTENSQAPQQLPKTGSDLPLVGMVGMLSAGTGLTLRRWLSRERSM